jgi:carboxyl-terminal processing protease
MLKERKIQSWLPLLLSLVMILGMAGGYQLFKHMAWRNRPASAGGSSSVQQVLDLVRMKYVDSIGLDSIEFASLDAITGRLDPHSVFIPASDLSEVEADLAGNFSGIGVEYQMMQDTVVVVNVVEKGPAATAGLLSGDAIVAVNDSIIAGKSITGVQLRSLLRGKRGTTVKVTLLRNGKLMPKTITRGEVPLPSVDAAYMITPETGYIKLNRFAETTFFEFMDAATALDKKGMKKMVLDLRGNGGGLLEEATKIADELLEDGLTIVSTRGERVKSQTVTATKPGIFEKGALMVLLDEQSASASEVLAGALQEHDRATIVGRRSFGKGLVQEQFNLSNGGALRITVARYFTPLGRSIQKPYNNGQDAYNKEISERIHNRSTAQQSDTLGKKVFVTRKGKKLYESGGITPDAWVPFDSTALPVELMSIYRLNIMPDLVFGLYRTQRENISRFNTPLSFDTAFVFTPAMWTIISQEAEKESLNLKDIKPKDRILIEERMKPLLARYKWRNNGFYELLNRKDSAVQKALTLLSTTKP